MTTDYNLKNIDSEDIENLLVKVEKSFGIQFVGDELAHIKTFGQLCTHIANKIQLEDLNDCTSQQAFYKLRNAISATLQIDNKTISIHLSLADLFPRRNRRSRIKELERHLGFKINILRPSHLATGVLSVLFFVSLIGLFINWQTGLLGLTLSIVGFWLADKTGNELCLQTVGQVAEKMTRENYLKSRRNPKSFNKTEIERILTDWFRNDLGLDKRKLTRDAKFE